MDPLIHLGDEPATRRRWWRKLSALLKKHAHVMGLPNSGKTFWLFALVQQLVAAGVVVIVLDFKFDLYWLCLLEAVRRRRARRTLVVDPYDAVEDFRVAPQLTPLDEAADPAIIAAWTKDSMKRLFQAPPGQFNSHIDDALLLGNNLLTQHAAKTGEPWSVFEVSAVLSVTHPAFRARLLQTCDDPALTARVEDLEGHRPYELSGMWNPVQTRVFQLRSSPAMPALLGGRRATVSLDDFLATRSGGLLLARLYDARLPRSDLDFLGAVLLQKIQAAVYRRPRRDWVQPVFLIVDEVQRAVGTAGEEFCDFLERSRSFGLNVFASHQFLSQLLPRENPLDRRLLDGLTQIPGIRAYFNTGSRDALGGGLVDEVCLPAVEARTREKKHITPAHRTRFVEETRRVYQTSESASDSWSEGESESGGTGSSDVSSSGASFGLGDTTSSALVYPRGDGLILPGGFGPAGALTEMSASSFQSASSHLHASGTSDFSGWATSRARGGGATRGKGEAIVPWLKPVEVVEEGQPTFYTPEEARLHYAGWFHGQQQRRFVLYLGTEAVRLRSPTVHIPRVFAREVRALKETVYARIAVPTDAILEDLKTRVPRFLAAAQQTSARDADQPPRAEAVPSSGSGWDDRPLRRR